MTKFINFINLFLEDFGYKLIKNTAKDYVWEAGYGEISAILPNGVSVKKVETLTQEQWNKLASNFTTLPVVQDEGTLRGTYAVD